MPRIVWDCPGERMIGQMQSADSSQDLTVSLTAAAFTRDGIVALLNRVGFAVLATEHAGQPHTSLVAITPVDHWRRLLFATYRNTRKFSNLSHNQRVSLLMDGRRQLAAGDTPGHGVLGAVGRVQEVDAAAQPVLLLAHLHRHPGLAVFMQSPDCVLLEVVVEAYQVVHGIDDVSWWCVADLNAAG